MERRVNSENEPSREAIGVVLFQLGGPDSLEAVEPFLYNLFCDPDIIDFPFARLARATLARVIASRRAKKVREHYARIGGKSPLGQLTERQRAALERELRKTMEARVFVAMRYWHPLTEEAVAASEARKLDQLVLLPLYPQYSRTTTGSSLNEWRRKYREARGVAVKVIERFYDNPLYIESVVEKVKEGLEKFERPDSNGSLADLRRSAPPKAGEVHLVFSAHGVPVSVIEAGDPYQAEVEATVRLVMERGGWPNPHVLCYQSRVGPGRWLRPSLEETLTALAGRGAKKILVVPISFVSDHVETLSEINIEAREHAERHGVEQFEVMPALNDSPKFIQALADLVRRAVGAKVPS